ncbi:hypothetical protein [Brevundimonas sp.]|uniref:hypothetical protein n=1 Tax=Brevundimonas sp. TaxID=1871086 RepID=UPI0025DD25F5|nr:hypothetical protein [Brevundimonas sp.]
MIPAKIVLNLSLILLELATNAVKYGAFAQPGGSVVITIGSDFERGSLSLIWQERGGPPCHDTGRVGFGTRLIEASVRHDLRGLASRRYEPSGLVWEFEFALPD